MLGFSPGEFAMKSWAGLLAGLLLGVAALPGVGQEVWRFDQTALVGGVPAYRRRRVSRIVLVVGRS